MSVQQFCLRWNNHQPNFISVCSSLLHNGTLVDVTLAAEGNQLQAHKIVLSACSSYFQSLFTMNPCQHPIVILKDVQYDHLRTMVDFMYYGEVNVSQDQLPHILKTAEMLKIKGLAEMPTDPANLMRSDSKSVNETVPELMGTGQSTSTQTSNIAGGSGNSNNTGTGLISNSTTGLESTLWSSSESQFHTQQQQQQQQQQHQQHQSQQTPQHQTQPPQHHQQMQQVTQQQQQLHAQLRNSQTQITHQHHQQPQQHHHHQQQQIRRTPSPLVAGTSPAARRKRIRKSSNNGSGERNNSNNQHNTSIETGSTTDAGGIGLSQMDQMSFSGDGGTANASGLSSLAAHSIHTTKLLKETASNDMETHPQDSDSLDDGHGSHVHIQIKPEVDITGIQQSIPLDISEATTPSEHDAPNNAQSAHSGLQWTVVESNYSRFALASCPSTLISHANNTNHNNNNGNANPNSNGNDANVLVNEQHIQQQQRQQQEQDVVNNQQQHLQEQLQYQQEQQNSSYSPQIITVSGYSNVATTAQGLSSPSPNNAMVQSVYSQGSKPSPSPIGNTSGSNSNNIPNSANTNGTGTGSGGGGSGNNVKRKRSVNPQGDENFIRALEAVRIGGIGFCKAARLYGVNNRTLWLEYKKRGYPISRPSIKSRVVKQEPNLSPSPTPPTNTNDDTNENYEHMAAAVAAAQTAALNMQIPPTTDTPTSSLICTPHHSDNVAPSNTNGAGNQPTMGVMSFLDTRPMDFHASLHSMTRQRYMDTTGSSGSGNGPNGTSTINVNPATAVNLPGINFNSM